jgi:hypothetical protein
MEKSTKDTELEKLEKRVEKLVKADRKIKKEDCITAIPF